MAGYGRVPFVGRQYEPSNTGRVADLIRRRGDIAADAALRAGDRSAQAWAVAGNTIGRTFSDLLQYKADEPRRKAEEAKLASSKREADQTQQISEALKLTRDPESGRLDMKAAAREVTAIDPIKGLQWWEAASQEDRDKLGQEHALAVQGAKDLGAILMLPPPMREEAFQRKRAEWQATQRPGAEHIPEHFDEGWAKQTLNSFMDVKDIVSQLGKAADDALKKQEPFTLGEGQTRFNPDGSPVASVAKPQPEAKKYPITVPGPDGRPVQKLVTEDELAKGIPAYREPKTESGARYQESALLGPDGKAIKANYDPRTGKYFTTDGKEVVDPHPAPSTAAKETSEDERKSVGWHRQMSQAIKTIDETETKLTEKELYQFQSLPQEDLIGLLNRGQMSENAKRYFRAFLQFTEARLRSVSGAAISAGEYAMDRQTYAKQYGETPTLAKDRQEARQTALDTLKGRAGRAYREDDQPNGGLSFSVQAPDGQTYTFPDQAKLDAFKKAAGIK